MEEDNRIIQYRSSILLGMFIIITLLLIGFLITIITTINSDRDTDNKFSTIRDRAMRGSIVSYDGYSLSYSQKVYRAEVNTLSIDPKKKDLFVSLFSIYSGIPKAKIEDKFINSRGKYIRGRVVLARNIDVAIGKSTSKL